MLLAGRNAWQNVCAQVISGKRQYLQSVVVYNEKQVGIIMM